MYRAIEVVDLPRGYLSADHSSNFTLDWAVLLIAVVAQLSATRTYRRNMM